MGLHKGLGDTGALHQYPQHIPRGDATMCLEQVQHPLFQWRRHGAGEGRGGC